MNLTPRERIGQEIDLPTPTAALVLLAHLLALLSALPLIVAMEQNAEALGSVFASRALIYAGVAVYTTGVAFECAQNTIDRWYLSTTYEAFCDGLFYSFMIAGFGLIAMGMTNTPWVWALAIVVSVAHPIFYVAGSWVRFPLLTAALLLVDCAGFKVLGDPIVFTHTLLTLAGLFFLALLMRTRAQWFHGLAASCFAISMFAFPWAIQGYVQGTTSSWLSLGVGTAIAAGTLGLLFPFASKSTATRRRHAPLAAPGDAGQLA